MHKWVVFILSFVFCESGFYATGQIRQKEINHLDKSWFSINTTARISNKWGFVADAHLTRNNFLEEPGFYFIRFGANYWLKDYITFTLGYAHLWQAPVVPGWNTYADENRIYQQAQIISKISGITMLHRLRNEQRWQEKIVNDEPTSENKFTDRIRYLISFNIPVFKSAKYPSLVISDELCVQFGKEIVYNTFDQNRLFIGIRQMVTKNINFDLGYMMVYQQKSTGYQYDLSNVFRWFIYYTPDLRKKHKVTK